MFGSNYFGNPYFGQGYAKAGTIYSKVLTATVTTTAEVNKLIIITKKATVTSTGSLVTSILRILPKLMNARTRFLNFPSYTERIFK